MKKEKKTGFGVIGLGRFGLALAKGLADAGADVLVIDESDDKLRLIRQDVQEAFRVGKLTKDALEETGINQCETVIVCIGERIDVSMLTTLNLLNLGVPRVIAKADSREHGIILERIGAEVVYPERETATRLAGVLMGSNAIDLMHLNDDYVISEIQLTAALHGTSISQLQLEKYDLRLVALEREPNRTMKEVNEEEILDEEDAIVVIGRFIDVDRFERNIINRE